ncbi:MAG: N-terminal phage integrase SAM-like domain-containing protein [Actinomycetota bacterium]|nr:N-terminal phage integrase SAM-like domain-containing protein [Actinomycetota bacterium]
MQGFTRQRGSSWELRVYVGRDAVTGRKRSISRTFKGGKRAQRALAALVAEADRGPWPAPTATVGELLEEWLAHASPGFSPKNAKETRGVLDRNLLPYLGKVPLSKLGAADLDRLYRRYVRPAARPAGRSPRPRSAAPLASCTGRSARGSSGAG